ncbi:MAG: hypothetical protein LBJ00_18280, partial [Planctomycetaceae bacterium]|nr:hypothetical protein [Planctomycetaceae bacterium]
MQIIRCSAYCVSKILSMLLLIMIGVVSFVAVYLCNGECVSACIFSRKCNCKTSGVLDFARVDAKSKNNVNNQTNNKPMKLISLVDTKFFSYVSSVSIKRTSDWKERDENITVSDVAGTRNVKIYWAEFIYKQEFTNGTELSREIKLGIVFGEKEKLVWFGQIGFCPQEQF